VEGAGVNLFADLGPGPATLVLAAHHDAVPGSPGANDNAASVGILLGLGARLQAAPPRRLRVRLAFFAGEERAMLGSRVHARRTALDDVLGVVSLELCGIGDTLALWDVTPAVAASPLVRRWIEVVEAAGYRRDETYHLAEPVPFFGSDHRPFADRGIPGVGLTVVPRASIEPLRAFIYGGVRGILVPPARRPPPFTTYHTAGDRADTLEPAALAAVGRVLEALVRALDPPLAAARPAP
jgi:Zn-dependent M28 family amino/carboxypeptidase